MWHSWLHLNWTTVLHTDQVKAYKVWLDWEQSMKWRRLERCDQGLWLCNISSLMTLKGLTTAFLSFPFSIIYLQYIQKMVCNSWLQLVNPESRVFTFLLKVSCFLNLQVTVIGSECKVNMTHSQNNHSCKCETKELWCQPTQVSEVVVQTTPGVSFNEALHKPPRLLFVVKLCRHPAGEAW